tara:strand:+ start:571 stop:1038 length:468 start_codon:yes stop_codon:yes gene_type:complete
MRSVNKKREYYSFDLNLVRNIAEKMRSLDGALLPILHSINDHFGYIDKKALPIIAEVLNLSQAEVYGVVSFYHDFKLEKQKKNIIKICKAEACQAMGSEDLYNHLRKIFENKDGISIEEIFCLGNCSLSPAAQVNGKLYSRFDVGKAKELLKNEL